MKALTQTDFHFEGQKSVYHGKVRDVYDINDDVIVMVATDRISAFDVVLPNSLRIRSACSLIACMERRSGVFLSSASPR